MSMLKHKCNDSDQFAHTFATNQKTAAGFDISEKLVWDLCKIVRELSEMSLNNWVITAGVVWLVLESGMKPQNA